MLTMQATLIRVKSVWFSDFQNILKFQNFPFYFLFFLKTYHLALHENVKRNLSTNIESLNPSDTICH